MKKTTILVCPYCMTHKSESEPGCCGESSAHSHEIDLNFADHWQCKPINQLAKEINTMNEIDKMQESIGKISEAINAIMESYEKESRLHENIALCARNVLYNLRDRADETEEDSLDQYWDRTYDEPNDDIKELNDSLRAIGKDLELTRPKRLDYEE